jgi:hypothetical protein
VISDPFNISFTARLEEFGGRLWGMHVKVPERISSQILSYPHRRFKFLINQTETLRGALMPSKSGYFILLNKKTVNKLELQLNEGVLVNIQPDESEYGMDMPTELMEMFLQDTKAKSYFDQLTPGKQRNLIYLVSSVQNPDSRIRKSLAICHHLTEVAGALDFKQLNTKIKYYNNNF